MSKITLVTGASRGIGKALVEDLIDRGRSVIVVARSEEKLTDLKKRHGEHFIVAVFDISSREQVRNVSKDLAEQELILSLFFKPPIVT